MPHTQIEHYVFDMKVLGQNDDADPIEAMLIYDDSDMDDENA